MDGGCRWAGGRVFVFQARQSQEKDLRQGVSGGTAMTKHLIVVVDDDESVRESLPDLLKEFGFDVEAFASAREFLASGAAESAGCLILDIAMPEMSGPELQRELKRRGCGVPIVFITAQVDEK